MQLPVPGADSRTVMTSDDILELTQLPQRLAVIGGGVVEIKKLWWNDFVAVCNKRAQTALRPAKLANKAGVLGAAYSAMRGKFRYQ